MDPTSTVSGQGLYHRGPFAWNVALTVRSGVVEVVPTNRLERLAGAQAFNIRLDAIEEMDRSWLRGITLRTASGQFRFSGAEMKLVYEALKLGTGLGGPSEIMLPDEVTLCEGAAELVDSPLWVTGRVKLTTRRLVFLADTGFQSVLSHDRTTELPIEWIAAWELDGDFHLRLSVDGGPGRQRQVLVFAKGVSLSIAVVLGAMGIVDGPEGPPLDRRKVPVPPAVHGVARLTLGGVPQSGHAAVGVGGVFAVTQDLLATVTGADFSSMGLDVIRSWSVPPELPGNLTLHHGGGRWVLGFVDRSVDTAALAQVVASVPPAGRRLLDTRHQLSLDDVDELVVAGASAFPENARQRGIAGVSVVYGKSLSTARRGWLLLLSSGFLVVDITETDASFMPAPFVDRGRTTVSDAGRLEMRVDRRPVAFWVVGGKSVARSLWDAFHVRRPERSDVFAAFPYVTEMLGSVQCLRVARDRQELFSRRMLQTTLEIDGLAFHLPLPVPPLIEPGVRVEVELGDTKTIYTFRTDIARVDIGDDRALVVLLLARTVERRENNRQAFRVAIELESTGRRMARHGGRPEGASLPIQTVDLSWTGVGLLIDPDLGGDGGVAEGQLLRLELELEGERTKQTVQVVQTHKVVGEPRVHVGCRFLNLTRGQQDWLQAAVIRQQMREVASKELKHEVGED